MDQLSRSQRDLVKSLTERLTAIPGVLAVVLGGSHARGLAQSGSDIDLGLFYSEAGPFSIEAIRSLAEAVACSRWTAGSDLLSLGAGLAGGLATGRKGSLAVRGGKKCMRNRFFWTKSDMMGPTGIRPAERGGSGIGGIAQDQDTPAVWEVSPFEVGLTIEGTPDRVVPRVSAPPHAMRVPGERRAGPIVSHQVPARACGRPSPRTSRSSRLR